MRHQATNEERPQGFYAQVTRLSAEERAQLERYARTLTYRAGEPLYLPGDPSEARGLFVKDLEGLQAHSHEA